MKELRPHFEKLPFDEKKGLEIIREKSPLATIMVR